MNWLTTILSKCASGLMQAGANSFQEFYAEHLRDNLFNGSLTFGGFLLAAYTFIVIHMKTNVFDDPGYSQTFKEKKKADGRLTLYGPLERMSRWLWRSVVLTLISGVLQLTLGFWKTNLAAGICVLAGLAALGLVGRSVYLMGQNMSAWFAVLNKEM